MSKIKSSTFFLNKVMNEGMSIALGAQLLKVFINGKIEVSINKN
jgi:hypothetical protein